MGKYFDHIINNDYNVQAIRENGFYYHGHGARETKQNPTYQLIQDIYGDAGKALSEEFASYDLETRLNLFGFLCANAHNNELNTYARIFFEYLEVDKAFLKLFLAKWHGTPVSVLKQADSDTSIIDLIQTSSPSTNSITTLFNPSTGQKMPEEKVHHFKLKNRSKPSSLPDLFSDIAYYLNPKSKQSFQEVMTELPMSINDALNFLKSCFAHMNARLSPLGRAYIKVSQEGKGFFEQLVINGRSEDVYRALINNNPNKILATLHALVGDQKLSVVHTFLRELPDKDRKHLISTLILSNDLVHNDYTDLLNALKDTSFMKEFTNELQNTSRKGRLGAILYENLLELNETSNLNLNLKNALTAQVKQIQDNSKPDNKIWLPKSEVKAFYEAAKKMGVVVDTHLDTRLPLKEAILGVIQKSNVSIPASEITIEFHEQDGYDISFTPQVKEILITALNQRAFKSEFPRMLEATAELAHKSEISREEARNIVKAFLEEYARLRQSDKGFTLFGTKPKKTNFAEKIRKISDPVEQLNTIKKHATKNSSRSKRAWDNINSGLSHKKNGPAY